MIGKKVKVFGWCKVWKRDINTVGFLIECPYDIEGEPRGTVYWTRPSNRDAEQRTTFSCVVPVPNTRGKWVSNLFEEGIDVVQFEELEEEQ